MWGRWMGVMATPLGVQEKISKINAELARLELEMELDHGGESMLGVRSWAETFKNAVGMGDSTATKEKKKKTSLELIDAAIAGFSQNVLTAVSSRAAISFTPVATPAARQTIIDLFTDKTKIEDVGALGFWNASFNGKPFYVIFRYNAGVSEYNLSLVGKENFNQFTSLKFTALTVVESRYEVAVNNFISRVLQCVVSFTDLEKFKPVK